MDASSAAFLRERLLLRFSKLISDGWTDRQTDKQIDRKMDATIYRVAMTRLQLSHRLSKLDRNKMRENIPRPRQRIVATTVAIVATIFAATVAAS